MGAFEARSRFQQKRGRCLLSFQIAPVEATGFGVIPSALAVDGTGCASVIIEREMRFERSAGGGHRAANLETWLRRYRHFLVADLFRHFKRGQVRRR